jgi:hypothetical protein
MDIFRGQNLMSFTERFKTDLDCKGYLSHIKWEKGFKCLKCGNLTSQIRKDFSRTCNKCSHTETASANTLFHKVKFGLRKAFFICFEMSTTTKSLSASYVGVRFGVTEKTARLFMHKVRVGMKSSGNHPMDARVQVDEFVLGGKEEGKVGRSYDSKKKKIVCALQLTNTGRVRRMYALKIENFSAKELKGIFTKHIDTKANITTDLWKGYRPIAKTYDITQIESNNGKNFKVLHIMIHKIKSWIRDVYSWVSDFNINRYLDEFCYRLNRSQSKKNIFNNIIRRMVVADKVYQSEIICS